MQYVYFLLDFLCMSWMLGFVSWSLFVLRLYVVFLSIYLCECDFLYAHESSKLVNNCFSHPQFLQFINTNFFLVYQNHFFNTHIVACVFFALLDVSLPHFVRWFLSLLLHVFLDLSSLALFPHIVARALFLFARTHYKVMNWLYDSLLCGFCCFCFFFLTHYVPGWRDFHVS